MKRHLNPRRLSRLYAGAFLTWTLASGSAGAGTITYVGYNSNGGTPLSAQATITTSLNTITITLSNTLDLSRFSVQSQGLSGISFRLNNTSGTLGTPSTTGTGQLANVAKGTSGNVSYIPSYPSPSTLDHWDSTLTPGKLFNLTALSGGAPNQLILPDLAGSTSLNMGSNVGSHNPFVVGLATFSITLQGVTANTTMSNVIFNFGTTGGEGTATGTPAVPEPASVAMALTSAVAVSTMALRRRARTA